MSERISLISAIRRWGNSSAVRLPLAVLKVAEFSLEQKVSVTAEKGRLTIQALARDEYSLNELIDGITEENSPDLFDYGDPVGKEVL